jgi:predicted ATPase/class 3 adenylate cyclase
MAPQVETGQPASARPTGTVTFLFSDIEGSAERWESTPDAMTAALQRYDALVRSAVEAHSGYLFKTRGDALRVAFARAPDALAAALAAQRALVNEDFSAVEELRVRMALHTGSVDESGGDYIGPTVNRVARLLGIGHGGQVLVSRTCMQLVQDELPAHCSLRDLGAHRLKDLAQPEHVHQLIAPDLPDAFPPLLSLDHLSNNLPTQLTSFIGREEVVAEIKELLGQHRLLTLTGTGGAGKTRCAIQVGAEFVDGSSDGVWLAELAPISDPSLVASVVARALSLHESPKRPVLDTLLAFLKRKRLLIILDNCEHVIEDARHVVAVILRGCPDVRILATSRESLAISGERVYRMPSLAVPSMRHTLSAQELLTFDAPLLFADRAISVDSRFALTDENAQHVAQVCTRLDGIPLAIELAAARVKVLSPKELAQKLDERFRVLTGGDRSALPRHQTMRALIDWSYDLLSDEERTAFRKISIFAGGFTLETACAVCGDAKVDEIATLELLSSLVDKSLVYVEHVRGGVRYQLLESTRRYALEQLQKTREDAAIARTHATAFLALAEKLDGALETTPDRISLALAEPELENFRAALSWALGARGDVLLGQRLAGALRAAWGYLAAAEGRRWVQVARDLADAETPSAVIAALDLCEAWLAGLLYQYNASRTAGEHALARYRELADPLRVAYAQQHIGWTLILHGNIEEGESLVTEALTQARVLRARRLTGLSLEGLAWARQVLGDVAGARQLYAEALEILQAVGAERAAAVVGNNLAETEFRGGDATAALRLAGDALAAFRAFNATLNAANVLWNMAAYLMALERYDEARLSCRSALSIVRDAQYEAGVPWPLHHLAAIAAFRPTSEQEYGADRLRAARLLGYVDARLAALEAVREYTEQQEYDKMLAALRNALGADCVEKLMLEGSTWSEDQAIAEAMLI